MLHADGKVITPLFRARPGDTRVDRTTGEIRPVRYEPDGGLHVEGDGETAWGVKFVLVAARTTDPHGRIILDIEWVPKAGGEARTAMDSFTRLAPYIEGAQGVIYDTALRGVHHQTLLRDLGLVPINRVTAAKANPKTPRRAERRVEKSAHIEDKTITIAATSLYAAAIGPDSPKPATSPSPPAPHHATDKNGSTAGTTTTTPGRYEQTSPSAPPAIAGSTAPRTSAIPRPDFALYPRRNDAESINRNIEDTLWIGRAHSIGHARQHLNLLGYALMVNGLALHRHRRQRTHQLAA